MSTPKRRKSKRKAPVHNTPPSNNVVKKSKDTQETTANDVECLICDNAILEPGENTDGHDAVFCEGDCQGWIHRHCASLTRPAFEKLLSESTAYLCPHCTLAKQCNEINALKETIKNLTQKLDKLECNQSKQTIQPKTTQQQQPMISSNQPTGPKTQPKTIQQWSPDRRCNVVFYGISECPPKTSRFARSQSDLKAILSTVPDIERSAIKDVYRLGKFKPEQQRPRPLLVEFLRALDAEAILSNRNKLSPPVLAKPDMTPEERNTESILLKERWNLIQQGYPRKAIKIRNAYIYVNNQSYGRVIDSKFNQLSQLVTLQTTSNTPSEDTITTHTEPSQSMDTASDHSQ